MENCTGEHIKKCNREYQKKIGAELGKIHKRMTDAARKEGKVFLEMAQRIYR
jgi:hypothetical protein